GVTAAASVDRRTKSIKNEKDTTCRRRLGIHSLSESSCRFLRVCRQDAGKPWKRVRGCRRDTCIPSFLALHLVLTARECRSLPKPGQNKPSINAPGVRRAPCCQQCLAG